LTIDDLERGTVAAQVVVVLLAPDDVIVAVAVDEVLAGARKDLVGPGGAVEVGVVACGAVDRVGERDAAASARAQYQHEAR
jgi:hypothetical protein